MAADVRAGQVDASEFRENLDHFLESSGSVRIARLSACIRHCRSKRSSPLKRRTNGGRISRGFRKGQMARADVTEEDLMRDIEELERQKKRARRT
jgi:hypothetical protein